MRIREVVPEALAGERLDRVVSMIAGVSRSEATALLAGGRGAAVGRPSSPRGPSKVAAGDVIELDVPEHDPTGGLEADASRGGPARPRRRRTCW